MIKCKVRWIFRDRDNDGAALVQDVKAKSNLYFIDAWRHALDDWQNRKNDLKVGDICYIEEWYLAISKSNYNKFPLI